MHRDVRLVAIVLTQQVLHLRCFVVGLTQGDVTIHEDVQFDGIVIADAARAEVVRLADTFNRVFFKTEGYTIGLGDQLLGAIAKL